MIQAGLTMASPRGTVGLSTIRISLITCLFICLSGCALSGTTTLYRQTGFAYVQASFDSLPYDPTLSKTYTLKEVTIHIVADCSMYGHACYRDPDKRVLGYVTANNEIWVLGKRKNGKIILNQAVLGHELLHLIAGQDLLDVMNPDLYDTNGM